MQDFEKAVAKQTSELLLKEDDKIKVIVKYDSTTLANPSVIVTEYKGSYDCPEILVSELGHQEICYLPWSWLSWEIRAEKEDAPKDAIEFEKQYINSSWQYRRVFQVAIEKILIGDELIAPWMQ